ncbi:DUF4011 domain-containing protein [Actinomyces naeslundii]|uniref:DUF4011 domain-containing protein n=1 Tax=Actinomyces naeslundii TaxID=1655 RepID=A0AA47INF0_ACTNA|nr:DUF4011 domain-containing protein [Actinomyces naeslundii]OMG17567.1 DNA helicase [Actinomyces naeslundii]PKY95898.1 DUF4011 domain-containing protein [Actinomyces naeslundii]WAL41855.1 DUF4011 domain-containing protein [Actinomyces naeslundii]
MNSMTSDNLPVSKAPKQVQNWQKSLLDLSLRNPLINRTSRHAVELCVPPALIGEFEDLVNDKEYITLAAGRHRPAESSDDSLQQEQVRAESLLKERTVEVELAATERVQRLQALATSARTAVEETGANNLYLAIGTLHWDSDGSRLHSPLILIPVNLERTGDDFRLILDETGASTPNYSFLDRFARDTGIELTELRTPRLDEHGIDLRATLDGVRDRLRRAGWDDVVTATVHLGLFRFSTYRMWKDLEDHWPTISANPLVAHLMAGGCHNFVDPAGPADRGLDIDEATQNLPLAADSTQARVVADAVAGRSLVVEGPPGTGKSQTVSNLIFRSLATGRTIMFVAEKKSALDVVARRLREETDIGDLLLNLHDNGMKPTEVRRALRRALALRRGESGDGVDVGTGKAAGRSTPAALRTELAGIRAELDAYRRGLYEPAPGGPSYSGAREVLAQIRDSGESGDSANSAAVQVALEERARATGLDSFDAAAHNRLIERYRSALDELRASLTPELVDVVLAHRDRVLQGAAARAEALRNELNRRRSAMSVRELMDTYGDLITALTPCLLVSPDSVARFFPADRRYVDIVVFDEASQIRVADAVGAMGRGRSVVVVGDPKQMPPTPGAGEARGEQTPEADSILTRCLDSGLLQRRLTWHYRSRDESLVAFSNRHYYGGRLLTFPTPLTIVPGPDAAPGGHGISLRRVRGRYFRPEDRARHPHVQPNTNPLEAKRVVDEVLRHVEACPDRLPSLGVITFNDRQRDLIENSLREIASPRVIEALDARDGLFVRNLENVQGEERDTILFSATFAANAQGDLPLNFGVLNHAGGERRLNVAITRARRQIIVFTSFDPQDLHAERTAYRGVKDLRAYLHQAAEGRAPRALPASQSPLSWHRREIAEALEAAGLTVRTGVGHSTFEIDLVLAVADQPGRPAVAVMLDGPQWNKREGVVDRDLLPVDVLRTMGWQRVERVWMPEWVADPKAVVARLVKAAGGHWAQQTPSTTVLESGRTGRAEDAASLTDDDSKPGAWGAADLGEEALVPASGPRAPGEEYTAWSPAGVRPLEILDRAGTDPEAKKVLVEVATTICQVEAPIARHRLYVKISRAFGLSRTVKSREESIRTALGEAFAYFDEDGFVWTSREAALAAPTYRRNALDHVDSIQEIHPRELVGLMAQARARNPEWASREDLFAWALKRLSAKNRSLGARGVSEALTRALKEAEREQS